MTVTASGYERNAPAHLATNAEWRRAFNDVRPPNGFNVILADPPWPWAARSPKGYSKAPEAHYETMSISDIRALPVEALASKNCALFLWCTWPLMPHWYDVISAWGFDYAGLAWEWLKFNPETGKYAFGPGYGTRKNVEPCILATRGSPQLRGEVQFFGSVSVPEGVRSVRDFIEASPHDAIRAPRREHSRKPDEQYERIETMFDGPYVELFARSERSRWVSIGNEAGRFSAEAVA